MDDAGEYAALHRRPDPAHERRVGDREEAVSGRFPSTGTLRAAPDLA